MSTPPTASSASAAVLRLRRSAHSVGECRAHRLHPRARRRRARGDHRRQDARRRQLGEFAGIATAAVLDLPRPREDAQRHRVASRVRTRHDGGHARDVRPSLAAISPAAAASSPIVIDRGEGCYIWDSEGNRYLDALSALYCVNIGYGPWPEIAEAARAQLERLPFFTNWVGFATQPVARARGQAHRARCRSTSAGSSSVGGGSEAVESALKIARQYHRLRGEPTRYKYITRRSAYHGTTLGRDLDQREPLAARPVRAAAPRLLPRADAVPLPLPVLRGEGGLHAPVRGRDRRDRPQRGPRDRRGGDPRAGAELGRLDRAAARLLRSRPRDLRRARAPARRRRGHLRLRARRRLVRLDPLRDQARPDDPGEGNHLRVRAARRRRRLSRRRSSRSSPSPRATFTHGITFGGHPLSCAIALANIEIYRARGPDRPRPGGSAPELRARCEKLRPSTRWSATCAATATSTRSSS